VLWLLQPEHIAMRALVAKVMGKVIDPARLIFAPMVGHRSIVRALHKLISRLILILMDPIRPRAMPGGGVLPLPRVKPVITRWGHTLTGMRVADTGSASERWPSG